MNGTHRPGRAAAPADAVPVRRGEELDWDRLSDFLRAAVPGLAGRFDVRQFTGGGANLTYLVTFDNRPLVVRRPPFGEIAPGAHDMRREFRALSCLWRHFDRAPRALLFCDDHSVIGADFLVMEYRSGEVVRDTIPASLQSHADVGRRIGFAVVDALADLHRLDPEAVGLGDLGRPAGFVQRQLGGWWRRWELVADSDSDPMMEAVFRRLGAGVPATTGVSLLHNDFKLDNCQFAPATPDRVATIFDWDMATIGEPLMDLGTLLSYWPDPADTHGDAEIYHPGIAALGLPARSEVVDRYAASLGADVAAVRWYEGFACWRTAVSLQQLYRRYARGETADARMAGKQEAARRQARRAWRVLDDAGL